MNQKHFDKKNEIKVSGINSAILFIEKFKSDIVKIYVHKRLSKKFTEVLLRVNSKQKLFLCEDEDLVRVSKSEHHEGVCIIGKMPKLKTVKEVKLTNKDSGLYILLDDVSNPHNVGAIIRTCSHFGVKGILVKEGYNPFSSATTRVSEGGVFSSTFITYKNLNEVKDFCKTNDIHSYVTELVKAKALYSFEFSKKSLVILGAEKTGVSNEAKAISMTNVTIPGTGAVESLNVSVACAVIASEFFRQNL